MKRWAIYEDATGAIRALLVCTEANAALQCRSGERVLEIPETFEGDDTTHRIEAGEIKPL